MVKTRYPAMRQVDGKTVCRGCGGPIGYRRQTWCSAECYKTRCPQMVIRAVKQRDKGICQLCGIDTKAATAAWREEKPTPPSYADVWNVWPYDFIGYKCTPEYREYLRQVKCWKNKSPKAEYDHIIPFSEGGPTTLENMRTLCRACHVKVTAEWRKRKRGRDE